MARINKITVGYVIQTFNTETREWESQEFVAADDVSYEDAENGDVTDSSWTEYAPKLFLEMVQPGGMEVVQEVRQRLALISIELSRLSTLLEKE